MTINGQAIRLTSLVRDEVTGALSLVAIVRGDAARDEITALFRDQPLAIAFPDESATTMRITHLELRSTGEGARTIHRFSVTLEPADGGNDGSGGQVTESVAESALMQRLDAIEQKLDHLLAVITRDQAHRSRRP